MRPYVWMLCVGALLLVAPMSAASENGRSDSFVDRLLHAVLAFLPSTADDGDDQFGPEIIISGSTSEADDEAKPSDPPEGFGPEIIISG